MALTAEQQSQLEFQEAQHQMAASSEAARRAYDKEMETIRHQNNLEIAKANAEANMANINKQSRIEAVRLAKETLIENRRSQPVDAREVSASDIIAFADALIAHINK